MSGSAMKSAFPAHIPFTVHVSASPGPPTVLVNPSSHALTRLSAADVHVYEAVGLACCTTLQAAHMSAVLESPPGTLKNPGWQLLTRLSMLVVHSTVALPEFDTGTHVTQVSCAAVAPNCLKVPTAHVNVLVTASQH